MCVVRHNAPFYEQKRARELDHRVPSREEVASSSSVFRPRKMLRIGLKRVEGDAQMQSA
jgi:hypothetical protein